MQLPCNKLLKHRSGQKPASTGRANARRLEKRYTSLSRIIMKIKSIAVLAPALFLTGCFATFTKTGEFSASPRSADCNFTVYTTTPPRRFDEIGLIEFGGNMFEGSAGGPGSVSSVKSKATEEVCKNGGNGLLLWETNGFGNYKKATVVYVHDA